MGCLRRAFGVGSNWPVVDIETVWEEYWVRVMAGLDKKEKNQVALEMMVSRGQAHEGNMRGKMDMHEGEGPAVECVPTKAGGEFLVLLEYGEG